MRVGPAWASVHGPSGPRPPRKYAGPTQDDVNLLWCQPRLELAFTAISLPHLAAIERQVLLRVDSSILLR